MLDGTNLSGADLGGAVMPHVVLTSCNLHQARFAGAWLDRTRMQAHQFGGMIGEEAAGEFEAACEGYIVLEQNFRTLGFGEDVRWAFLRRRGGGPSGCAPPPPGAVGRGPPPRPQGCFAPWPSCSWRLRWHTG